MTWLALLEKSELTEGLASAELEKLYALFEPCSFKKGEIIFEEDSRGRELFLVCEGRVEIQMRGFHAGDDRLVVNDVRKGQVFGEIALVDGAPRSARAKAGQDLALLMLREESFRLLAEREARIGYIVMRNLARTVAQRLRTTNYRLRNNHDWVSILGGLDLPDIR